MGATEHGRVVSAREHGRMAALRWVGYGERKEIVFGVLGDRSNGWN